MMIMISHYQSTIRSSISAPRGSWFARLAALAALLLASVAIAQTTVVVSIEPYRELVSRLLPDDAEVTVLVAPGASPHGFDPSPRDVSTLADADLVFLSGGGIDDWVAELVEAAGTSSRTFMAIEAFEPSELLEGAHDHEHDHDHEHGSEDDHEHDHGSDEEHDHDHEHGSEDDHADGHASNEVHAHAEDSTTNTHSSDNHEHNAETPEHQDNLDARNAPYADVNPHIWLSPSYIIRVTEAFASVLIDLHPERASEVMAARDAYVRELRQLNEEVADDLRPYEGAPFVPFHGAWSYFAADYGLDVVAVIEPFPGREPTPQQLVETIAILKQVNAGAIFSESQLNNQPAFVLADEANVPLGILDPLGGVEGREGYIDLMRYNSRMIADTFDRAAE